MLKSYPAQLDGVTLRWLDRAPARAPVKPVMVVVDESDGDAANAPSYRLRDLRGRLIWRGDVGHEQRTQRDAW
jgi:hypothetical protein